MRSPLPLSDGPHDLLLRHQRTFRLKDQYRTESGGFLSPPLRSRPLTNRILSLAASIDAIGIGVFPPETQKREKRAGRTCAAGSILFFIPPDFRGMSSLVMRCRSSLQRSGAQNAWPGKISFRIAIAGTQYKPLPGHNFWG